MRKVRTIDLPMGGPVPLSVDVWDPAHNATDEMFRASNIEQGKGYVGQGNQRQAPSQPVTVDRTSLDSGTNDDIWTPVRDVE
jgi:hypothetical protein